MAIGWASYWIYKLVVFRYDRISKLASAICGHPVDWPNTTVPARIPKLHIRLVLESINIHTTMDTLNRDIGSLIQAYNYLHSILQCSFPILVLLALFPGLPCIPSPVCVDSWEMHAECRLGFLSDSGVVYLSGLGGRVWWPGSTP